MKRTIPLFLFASLALAASSQQAWTGFQGNAASTGYTPVLGPTSLSVSWSVNLGGPIVGSPVVGRDGTIYTGSVWNEALLPRASINAVLPTGQILWRYDLPMFEDQVSMVPALGPKGTLYVGTADGQFLAISPKGLLMWRRQTLGPVVSSPVADNSGNVYAHLDDRLEKIDFEGHTVWTYPLGRTLRGGVSIGSDGTVYAVAASGVVALRPDGTRKWLASTQGGFAPPAVSPNGDIIVVGGPMVALDADTGAVKWLRQAGSHYGGPAIDPAGFIYYAWSWNVQKISPTGVLIWERELLQGNRLGSTYSSMVVDGRGNLFFGMGTGLRWAIDLEKNVFLWDANGQTVSSFALPEPTSSSSPAFGPDGTLYIGCLDGRLYAFR